MTQTEMVITLDSIEYYKIYLRRIIRKFKIKQKRIMKRKNISSYEKEEKCICWDEHIERLEDKILTCEDLIKKICCCPTKVNGSGEVKKLNWILD